MANLAEKMDRLLDALSAWLSRSPARPPAFLAAQSQQQAQQAQANWQPGQPPPLRAGFPLPSAFSQPLTTSQLSNLQQKYLTGKPDVYGATAGLLGSLGGVVPGARSLAQGMARLRGISESWDHFRRTLWGPRGRRQGPVLTPIKAPRKPRPPAPAQAPARAARTGLPAGRPPSIGKPPAAPTRVARTAGAPVPGSAKAKTLLPNYKSSPLPQPRRTMAVRPQPAGATALRGQARLAPTPTPYVNRTQLSAAGRREPDTPAANTRLGWRRGQAAGERKTILTSPSVAPHAAARLGASPAASRLGAPSGAAQDVERDEDRREQVEATRANTEAMKDLTKALEKREQQGPAAREAEPAARPGKAQHVNWNPPTAQTHGKAAAEALAKIA